MPPAKEPPKAPPPISTMLGNLSVAVLDADIPAAQLMRRTLNGLGIMNSTISRDPQEILNTIVERDIDVLIVEWECRGMSGLDVTKFVRSTDFPNRMLPVILTTFNRDEESQREARNAGVDEIITKPFAAKDIAQALTSIIDAPRDFIITRNYAGPDRRMDPLPELAPGFDEGRMVEIEPVFIERAEAQEIYIDEAPRIILPDFQLKQKLCERAGEAYAVPADITRRLEDSYQTMVTDCAEIRKLVNEAFSPNADTQELGFELGRRAMAIRTRALRSRYTLAARVCAHIYDLCKRLDTTRAQHKMVLEMQLGTLHAILNARLEGDDNPMGRELLEELKKFTRRYT